MDDDLRLWGERGVGLCSGADKVQQGIQPTTLERVGRLIDASPRLGVGSCVDNSSGRGRGGGGCCADRGEEAVGCGAGGDAGPHDQVAAVVMVPAERPSELGEFLAVAQRLLRGAVVLAAAQRRATPLDLGRGRDPGEVDQLGLDARVRNPGDGTHLRVRQRTAGEVRVHHGQLTQPTGDADLFTGRDESDTAPPVQPVRARQRLPRRPPPALVVLTDHRQERTHPRGQLAGQPQHVGLQALHRHLRAVAPVRQHQPRVTRVRPGGRYVRPGGGRSRRGPAPGGSSSSWPSDLLVELVFDEATDTL